EMIGDSGDVCWGVAKAPPPATRWINIEEPSLRQQLLDHLTPLIGEPHAEPFVLVHEAAVVEAEEVEDGGVEVVHVDGVLGDAPAQLVGGAEHLASFDAAAGHPEAE